MTMTATEIRNLEINAKMEYFRNLFMHPDTVTEEDILNVYRLVNSYNTFDDNFFTHESSYISDITEFIDLKMGLENEIAEFSFTLIKWYLSLLSSCDIKADDEAETYVEMPKLICGFFTCATIPVMSSIMNKVDLDSIDKNSLFKVKGAFSVLANLFNSHSFVASYFDFLAK